MNSNKVYAFGKKHNQQVKPKNYSVNIYYDIAYKFKDMAKSKGLRWDVDKKLWYSIHKISDDDKVDLNNLTDLFEIVDYKFNFECSNYEIYINQITEKVKFF